MTLESQGPIDLKTAGISAWDILYMKYTEGNLEVKREFIGKLSDLACIDIPNQLAPLDNVNYCLGPGDEEEGQDEGSDDTMDLSGLVD